MRSIKVGQNHETAMKKYRLLLFIGRNVWISRTEFVYDKQARDCEHLWPYPSMGAIRNYDGDDDDDDDDDNDDDDDDDDDDTNYQIAFYV